MRRAVVDDVLAFAAHFGLNLYQWQRDALGDACQRTKGQFRYRLAGISVPRGNGKTYASAIAGLWQLLSGPTPQDIISAALDLDGAKVVLDHARGIIRGNPELVKAIEVQAGALIVPATGSRWTIASREHTASRGRHPTLVLYDECGWAKDDELFSSLLAGQASVADPLCLVLSTVGRRQSGPLWTVKALAEGGDEGVYWFWRGENLSPKVLPEFLDRQRRILAPAQYAREHQNAWLDVADSFVSAEHVDLAMHAGWLEQARGKAGVAYHAYVDVGIIHDPSVIAVGHAEEDGVVHIDRLLTFQGSRTNPVKIQTLEQALVELATHFNLTRIRVESWQGLGTAERLAQLGLPVEVFTPTPKANADEWMQLAQRFVNSSVVLFPHARLREELLNLAVEVGPTGPKVTDKGKVHQDHAVAVRGVVASLGNVSEPVIAAANLASEPVRHRVGDELTYADELRERD